MKITIQNQLIAFIVMPVVAFAIMVVTALGLINYTENSMKAMYVDRIEPLAGLRGA